VENNTEVSSVLTEPTAKITPPTIAKHSSGPGWVGAVTLSLVVSLIVSALTAYIYDIKFAQKIVSVDIKGYVAKQGEDYMTGKITETEFRQKFDHLENVVKAIPANKAVLMGDLVVRNVQVIKP